MLGNTCIQSVFVTMAALGDVLHKTFVTILFTGSVLGAVGLGTAMVQRLSYHRGTGIEVRAWMDGVVHLRRRRRRRRRQAAADSHLPVRLSSCHARCRSSLILLPPQQQQLQPQSPRSSRRQLLADVTSLAARTPPRSCSSLPPPASLQLPLPFHVPPVYPPVTIRVPFVSYRVCRGRARRGAAPAWLTQRRRVRQA